jgi:DNA-binding protein HU-beta
MMNKSEFIDYMAKQHNCTKVEAEKVINMFTASVTAAMSENQEIGLVGFGNFYSSKVEERVGRNPRTGDPISIEAYVQPKFRAGQKLKDACNKK